MSNESNICPACEEGTLIESRYEGNFKHNGGVIRVTNLECYECDTCGADPVFEDQIRRNHLKIANAKRKSEGLLKGEEIRSVRKRLRLSQKEASFLFGGGVNSFSKYERGDVLQSVAMDRLVRLASESSYVSTRLSEMAYGRKAARPKIRVLARSKEKSTGEAHRPTSIANICKIGEPVVTKARFFSKRTANQDQENWIEDQEESRCAHG